jgi:hypothetical protein
VVKKDAMVVLLRLWLWEKTGGIKTLLDLVLLSKMEESNKFCMV